MRIKRITLLICLAIGACQADRAPTVPESVAKSGPPERPIITPSQATLQIGDSLRLTIAAKDNPALPVHAVWTSLNPAIAQVDSAGGLVRARSLGVTAIKAALVSDPTQVAAILVQVNP